MAGNRGGGPGQSVTSRAFALLGAFDVAHPRLTLTEMARRAGLPMATAHRLAAELAEWGALDRDEGGRYRIGLRLWEAGLLAPVSSRLREIALPFLQDLYEANRENVHLAVRDAFDALYVEKLAGHRSVPILSRIGARLPLHATGVGKALLAHAGPAFVQAYCERPLPRYTRYTIAERGRLLRELALTRERGWAQTSEEMSLGSCSVAVPVREDAGNPADPARPPAAALGFVIHTTRATDADLARLVPALTSAAAGIADRLAEAREAEAEADAP